MNRPSWTRLSTWLRLFLGQPTERAEKSLSAQVYAHRERLLGQAMELLGDPSLAVEAVVAAMRIVLGRTSSGIGLTAGQIEGVMSAEHLAESLDNALITACLDCLKETPSGRSSTADNLSAVSAPTSASTPKQDVETAIQEERTALVLSQLQPEARLTVLLIVGARRSLPQVAAFLGASEEAVRFWLGHGRKQLRRALQRDLLDDEPLGREARVLVSPGALYDLRRNKKATARA